MYILIVLFIYNIYCISLFAIASHQLQFLEEFFQISLVSCRHSNRDTPPRQDICLDRCRSVEMSLELLPVDVTMSDTDVGITNWCDIKIASTVLQAILTAYLHFGILNTERGNYSDSTWFVIDICFRFTCGYCKTICVFLLALRCIHHLTE